MELQDAPAELGALAALIWSWSLAFLPRLGSALLMLVVGIFIANWASRWVSQLLTRATRLDDTLRPVIRAIVRYAILIIVVVAVLGQLGVQTASVLAALGAAGLAIGLALQGTLQNIAAGMMLLWLRPFRVGDFIESPGVAGTVEEVGLFTSQLRTWDGIYKFVPNSELWNTILTNYSRNATRLVIIDFGIAYENDIGEGRRVLAEFAAAHPKVLTEPPVQVVPMSLADSAVVLQLRAWAPNSDFWAIRWDLTEGGKLALEKAGLTIPFPQRVVHMIHETAPGGDPTRGTAVAAPAMAASVVAAPAEPSPPAPR